MSRASRHVAFKLAAVCLACLVALLTLEGLVRVRQWLKYQSASPTVHEFETDASSGLRVPRRGMKRGPIEINSLGFRGPELTTPKRQRAVRIAFLGGSTTYCAEVSSNEATWPHLVVDQLARKFPETAIDYVNGGVPGYTTSESLRNLDSRVAPLEPDAIVIYHGTNDLSGDSRRVAEQHGLFHERPDTTSALGQWSTLWFLLEKNWTIYRRQAEARVANDRLQFVPAELSPPFQRRLEALVQRAKRHAPVVALVTFSHRVRHHQSREEQLDASNTSLYYMPYMSVEGLLDGFDEYNRVVREVAEKHSVILVDAATAIPGDGEHFVDSVHLSDAGAGLLAELVADGLARSDSWLKLLEHTPSVLDSVREADPSLQRNPPL